MSKIKVYVVTRAIPLGAEVFEEVFGSRKAAEKHIRSEYPNARKDDPNSECYVCKKWDQWELMFIHEREVETK